METHTYWASIGRNASLDPADAQEPLDIEAWRNFEKEIRDTIHEHAGTILATVHGTSEWEGVPEDTTLVLFTIGTRPLPSLRAYFAHLAHIYGQSAIGLVGGPGETLVTPSK